MTTGTQMIDSYLDLMKRVLTASIYDESAWVYMDPPAPALAGSKNPLQFSRDLLRFAVVRALRRRSIIAARRQPFDRALREEGRDWPCFGYTMAGHRRLENVQRCVGEVLNNSVPGDLLEAGAWRGGTTIFMRAMLKVHGVTDRKVWVADSFEGLPAPKNSRDGADLTDVNVLKVSVAQVRANFAKFGLLDEQVEFLEGWFSDTLAAAPIERLAILRLDGDMYSSTMDTLEALYDKVSPGGYVIVDDYNSWRSCHRAVRNFLRQRSLKPEIKSIDWAGAYWQV